MIWLYCSFDEIRRNLRGPGVPLDFVTNRDFGALLGTLGTPCGNQRQKVSDSSTITYRIHLLDESESSEKIYKDFWLSQHLQYRRQVWNSCGLILVELGIYKCFYRWYPTPSSLYNICCWNSEASTFLKQSFSMNLLVLHAVTSSLT